MIKIVFHVHSQYSPDSNLSQEKIAEICRAKNIKTVILADHNNLAPARIINSVRIIPGEEIQTKQGEIIGLFLKYKIPKGLSLKQSIKKIKKQEGLVVAPHPFEGLRLKALKKEILIKNINEIDIIEVFNSRNLFNSDNKKACALAKKYKKIQIAGSDAHLASEICNTIIEMEKFHSSQEFLKNLKQAKFRIQKAGPWVHLATKFINFF